MRDLGSNFFLTEADVGKPRASACAAKLAELNSMVTVRCVELIYVILPAYIRMCVFGCTYHACT